MVSAALSFRLLEEVHLSVEGGTSFQEIDEGCVWSQNHYD